MTVVSLDEHRARKAPAWNPKTQRHSWLDIDEDGHHHKCLHCWVRYHSEPNGSGGFVKVWSHGPRSGKSTSLGRCPGPSGRPTLAAVADVLVSDTDGDAVPLSPAKLPLCARCNPPCGRPGHPYLGGATCDQAAAAVAEANARYLRELRAATSGMGVPTWRGGAA